MADFAHLHVHTDASLKDGMTPVWNLVDTAKERGFKALAMTDHGSLANAIAFTIECERAGIKPILGLEAYINVDGFIGHMTLLADGPEGFKNLVELNNLGHASTNRQPAFTIDQLIERNKNIILLSGCISSPLNQFAYKDALKLQARLMGTFGPRFFQEMMFVADIDTWSRPMQLSSETGAKLVITNDVHFPRKTDAPIHSVLTMMKAGFEYNSGELWLKQSDAIYERARAAGIPDDVIVDAIYRAGFIARKIRSVPLKGTPRLPAIENADHKLRNLVLARLDSYSTEFGSKMPEYVKRIKYELDIIMRMHYGAYFLILDDIVSYARENDVYVGPGRGSGAGSLVLYVLGITKIDPLKYELSFERFLNPEREGMPDVDIDFDSEHRDKVLEYAARMWNASPIATYVRYSHKTLVHDLAKILRLPRDLEKLAADNGEDSDEFRALCDADTKFEHAYGILMNQIRHKGKHAGGVIITEQSVPLERTGDKLVASWTEGLHNELSYVGIVKFDLLGLSALSALRRLEKRHGKTAQQPKENDKVFTLFQTGDLAGIFQFSGSDGIKKLTVKLHPTRFEDLVAINALYRPGALDVGATDAYPKWKKEPRRIHPSVDRILAPTYGAIVYQEQVMAIFSKLTGGSLGEADLARRIIVKAKPEDPEWVGRMNALRETFVTGAVSHGFTKENAETFWHELAAHSRYSFNKAHAVAYARIAWELAWWKYYYPASFYAEMLNTDPTQAQTYIVSAVEASIAIVPPHISHSSLEYEPAKDKIFMPLSSVKYLSTTAATAIVSAREKGAFTTYEDFMARVPKKFVRANARQGLFKLDAFSGLSGSPAALGIKDHIASIASDVGYTESQLEYLGLIVPTKWHLQTIRQETARGNVCGIVTQKKRKESKYGQYVVYYLSPSGVFWHRGEAEFFTGQLVSAQVNDKNGKAIKAKVISAS